MRRTYSYFVIAHYTRIKKKKIKNEILRTRSVNIICCYTLILLSYDAFNSHYLDCNSGL